MVIKKVDTVEGFGLNMVAPPPYYHYWQARLLAQFNPELPAAVKVMGFGNLQDEEVVWLLFSGDLWVASLWEAPSLIIEALYRGGR